MASEIDICNLALGHLGDTATVSSIKPPEGSAQSQHCARFYPIARDTLFEMHAWGFATKRVSLAALTSAWPEWDYCYALPSDVANLLAIIPPDANDDYSSHFVPTDTPFTSANFAPVVAAGRYVPQDFSSEILEDGTEVIYTDQQDAVLRYTAIITDPTKFSPLFTMTLSWHLASMLAGPIIKGDAGAAEAKRCTQMAMGYLSQAEVSDSNQRRNTIEHIVPWTSGR